MISNPHQRIQNSAITHSSLLPGDPLGPHFVNTDNTASQVAAASGRVLSSYVACRRFSYQDRHMLSVPCQSRLLIPYQQHHMFPTIVAGTATSSSVSRVSCGCGRPRPSSRSAWATWAAPWRCGTSTPTTRRTTTPSRPPSRGPSFAYSPWCTHSTRAGIEWCRCHRGVCMAWPR